MASVAEATGPLAGRVAVVTGANRGIGWSIALEMARAGAAVAVAARDPATLEPVAEAVRRAGVECLQVSCDVTDEASVESMGSAVLERFGRADAVVANAGVAGPTKPMQEITLAEWRECLAIAFDDGRFNDITVNGRGGNGGMSDETCFNTSY